MGVEEDFAKALENDPRLLDRLTRQGELADFKAKYNIDRSSGLRCPFCNQFGQTGGALWYNSQDPNPTTFVCRKDKLVFKIESQPLSMKELIKQLKEISK